MKKYKKIAILLFFLSLINGCISITKAPTVSVGTPIKENTVILVGRINMIPTPEQSLPNNKSSKEWYQNKFNVILDPREEFILSDDLAEVAAGRSILGVDRVFNPVWNEIFTVEVPRQTTYIKGIKVAIDKLSHLLVRTNMKIDLKDTDQIVYIGDITLTLNKKDQYIPSITDNYKETYPEIKQWEKDSSIKIRKNIVDKGTFYDTISARISIR